MFWCPLDDLEGGTKAVFEAVLETGPERYYGEIRQLIYLLEMN